MKARTSYAWTTEDASRDFVVEAYNRLRNFIREDEDDLERQRTGYRRAVLSGSDFAAADVVGVVDLLSELARRAEVRAGQYGSEPQGPALLQAAMNAREVGSTFMRMFTEAMINADRGEE